MNATHKLYLLLLAIVPTFGSCHDHNRRVAPLTTAALASITFDARRDINIGAFATNTIISDIDGDGIGDIVVARYQEAKISWIRSLGNGSYAAPVELPAGPLFPLGVAAADMDNDGAKEILAADFVNKQFYIYKNLGGGSFANPINVSTSDGALSIVAADFDNDGVQDVAVGGVNEQNIRIHRGLGSLTFAASAATPVAGFPAQILAMDLDNDSRVDLVFTDPYDAKLRMLKNVVDLQSPSLVSFARLFEANAGVLPFGLAAGDLDNDGKPEFVTSSAGEASAAIWKLTINGLQVFDTVPTLYTLGWLAMGDFNGDTKLDLAGACFEQNGIQIWPGLGNATFGAPIVRAVAKGPVFLASGDTTNDGRADIVVANALSAEVSIFSGVASGFVDGAVALPGGAQPLFIQSGDFDNDGDQDLVSADDTDGSLFVIENKGNLQFSPAATLACGSTAAFEPLVFDFDDDGDMDIISLHIGGARVFRNDGGFTFQPVQDFVVNGGLLLGKAADLNRDGVTEFVASAPSLGAVMVFESAGGSLVFKSQVAAGVSPLGVDAADLDRDGDMDIIVANNGDATVSIATRSKTGYKANAAVISVGSGPVYVKIGDFNKDGRADFAVSHSDNDNIEMFKRTTGLNFSLFDSVATNGTPLSISVGDLNLDGRDDLLYVENKSGRAAVRLSQKEGGVTVPVAEFAAQYDTIATLLVDLDGDSLPELVTTSALCGLLEIHKNLSN